MSRHRATNCRRRGFATLMALSLIGIVGVTLTILASTFAADVKRSVRSTQDAQLRQLLLAGEVAAGASLDQGAPAAGDQPQILKLPADLAQDGWSLTFSSGASANGADTREIQVTARHADGRSMLQTLRYAKVGGTWRLTAATQL